MPASPRPKGPRPAVLAAPAAPASLASLAALAFLAALAVLALAGPPAARAQSGAAPAAADSGEGAGDRPVPALRVAAVGDIMMGTENLLPPDGAKGFFKDMAPLVEGYDVVLGNLEGPLTDRGAPTKVAAAGRSYCFRTPPSYGRNLADAGFNVVSLANNHANDYGPEGRAQTIEVLEELGIAHTGAPGQITEVARGGRRAAVIGLAPNRGCQSIGDIEGAAALVRQAVEADPERMVLVTFHGGAEGTAHMVLPHGPETYLGEARGDLIRLAHAVIDAGAAAVIGHGPHVPRALEIYKGHLVAYSLGNFATASGINVSGATGLAPLLLFDLGADGRVLDYSIVSFRQQKNRGPRLDPSDEAAKVIGDLSDRLARELAGR